MLESEVLAMAGRVQPGRSIDQEERVGDEMFLTEFCEEHLGERLSSGREEPKVQYTVCGRINRGIQPVALVIDLDHDLVDRDVIRVSTLCGL